MTNNENTIDQTPLNVADASGTTAAITTTTAPATTTTPMGNVADETTRRSLFGAGQMGSIEGSTSATVAAPTLPAVPGVISQGLMPDKFDGKGFKTWQKKMMFFLTMMKLDKFIQEDKPMIPHGIEDVHTLASVDIWVHSDFIWELEEAMLNFETSEESDEKRR